MKDLVEYIVKSLVSNSDALKVTEERNGSEVNLILSVDPVDMGLVIGKSGQTIKAIRKILTIRAIAENVKVYLRLEEPEGGRPTSSETTSEGGELADTVKSANQSDKPQEAKTPKDKVSE